MTQSLLFSACTPSVNSTPPLSLFPSKMLIISEFLGSIFEDDNRANHDIFQSSLDRGCFSCECLLIPENQDGLTFWRHRIGSDKIDQLLQQRLENGQELFIELSKCDMRTYLSNQASEESS